MGDWVLLSTVEPDWGGAVNLEVYRRQDTGAALVVELEAGFESTSFGSTWGLEGGFSDGVVGGVEVESDFLLVL